MSIRDLPEARHLRVPVVDAIECMVLVLGDCNEDVLLCSTVDAQSFVGPGNCFSLEAGLPPDDVLTSHQLLERVRGRLIRVTVAIADGEIVSVVAPEEEEI